MATSPKAAKKAVKKTIFVYEGKDRRGTKVKGEMPGQNAALVRADLRRQGIAATKVRKKPKPLFGTGKKKIKPIDVAIFTRQLATMTKAGVPLVQAFGIVAEGLDHSGMQELVTNIKQDVEAGNSFASTLRKYPLIFDDLYCSLIDSGEQSGALETMLDRVATYKEKSEALKQKIKKALKYPMTVVFVAIIVTVILLLKVVPVFQQLFSNFGAALPVPTQIVVNLSKGLQENGLFYLVVIVAFFVIFFQAKKRSRAFSDLLDRIVLKLPIAGDIVFKSTIARYARTLSTTFSAGVPLIEALESCAGATGNCVYREAVYKVRDDVATGTQLQFAMRQTGVFPSMALQMTAIGEESGALDEMLSKVATYYEEEVDNAVDGLTSMMEPLIMAVLGVLVGGLIIAMYLPIFQLGSVVGG